MGERYTVNRERMMKDKMREEERNRERDRERETTVISKLDHTVMDLTILPQQFLVNFWVWFTHILIAYCEIFLDVAQGVLKWEDSGEGLRWVLQSI